MTFNETKNLLAWTVSNFPAMQERDMGPTAKLWYQMLKDIPYKIAEQALFKLLATAKFFPTVSEILEVVADITNQEADTAAKAWGEVEKAIGHYGHRREAEALESMSPRTAKVVKYMGWRDICLGEEIGVVRGQFLKMYQQVAEREQKERVLPESLKADIKRLNASMGTKMIEEGER
ncbi:MAG TPA: hypothetical protein GXZ27_06005 [Thermoanaerobacterales bacterium]|nr:hypothetical protein [Thermoanaerobacterales bacterium]